MQKPITTTLLTLAAAAAFACGGPVDTTGADEAPSAELEQAEDALSGASTCGAVVGPHFNWIGASSANWVNFRLVSHQTNGRVIMADGTFTQRTLGTLSPGCLTGVGPCTISPSVMSGGASNATRLFSDRTYLRGLLRQPFDVAAPDAATVSINDRGAISITRGGVTVSVSNVECLSGNLYGVGSDGVLYSITFTDEFLG